MRFYHLLLCFLPVVLAAQPAVGTVSMDVILASAWQDALYQQMEADEQFLAGANLDLPRLEELEFRTETQEFDRRRQEYAVRLQLNSSNQIRTQAAIRTHSLTRQVVRQQAHLEELLYQRYQLVVAVHTAQQWDQLYQAQQALLEDQKRIITRQLEHGRSQAFRDLLQWEDDQMNHTEKQVILTQRRGQLEQQLQLWIPDGGPFTGWSNFPSLDLLQTFVSSWGLPTVSLEQRLQSLDTEEVTLELAQEEAEQRNLLNFLQLRYTGDNDPLFSDRLTVGAGINLPFRNANSVKMQYLELERREEELKQQAQGQQLTEEWLSLVPQWQDRLRNYQQARDELRRYEETYTPTRLLAIGVQDAEVLLQAQAGILKRRARVLESQQQAYQQFLDLLLLSGRMTEQPYRNWLTNTPLAIGN